MSILDGTSPASPSVRSCISLSTSWSSSVDANVGARPIAVEVRVAGVWRVVVDDDALALDVVAMYGPVDWHPVFQLPNRSVHTMSIFWNSLNCLYLAMRSSWFKPEWLATDGKLHSTINLSGAAAL